MLCSFMCTAKRISYTYIHSFFRFFSYIDHYIALSGVPYAIQEVQTHFFFLMGLKLCDRFLVKLLPLKSINFKINLINLKN